MDKNVAWLLGQADTMKKKSCFGKAVDVTKHINVSYVEDSLEDRRGAVRGIVVQSSQAPVKQIIPRR
jgi:hypothetical protein